LLPGSFVERQRSAARPTVIAPTAGACTPNFQISVLLDGKPKALNIPAALVEKVRQKIEMRRRFEAAAATCGLNRRRFLKEKGRPPSFARHRVEAYRDKLFGFSDLVSALPEGRQSPRHSWKRAFDAVFLGAATQIPSLLQIEAESVIMERWPNASGRSATTPSPIRSKALHCGRRKGAPCCSATIGLLACIENARISRLFFACCW
jgi:hypothetical protein